MLPSIYHPHHRAHLKNRRMRQKEVDFSLEKISKLKEVIGFLYALLSATHLTLDPHTLFFTT